VVTALHAPMIAVNEYIKNTNKNCDHTTSYLKVVVAVFHASVVAVNENVNELGDPSDAHDDEEPDEEEELVSKLVDRGRQAFVDVAVFSLI
jgi:hypothetical protein